MEPELPISATIMTLFLGHAACGANVSLHKLLHSNPTCVQNHIDRA